MTNLVPRARIAIVGVSALFPGSLDVTGFWRDILQGNDLMSEVPPTHWLLEDYFDPDPSAPDKTYANRGAFLGEVPFDAIGWGVPPNIIPATDTSQLLALIVAQKVLDDACSGHDQDRSRTSVILGVTSGQELLGSMVSRLQRPVWLKALRESGLPETEAQDICDRISGEYTDWNESTFPGLLGNVVAGRIANRLNLGGTNCVTDAACASTFSALSMGINELQLGDSDMVIAGGVDTMNDIFMFMCFSKTPALSPTGDCRPFSDQADGTMLGEGLGMVAIKRLADAERDGDHIYAVIDGVGSSSDGRSKSVYAPVSEGQADSLRRAYELAGYGPDTIELIEAHGTGTIAGDAAEIGGLKLAFEASGRLDRQWCAVGSVKSQIGHTKAAAGAAGLIKAVMAVHHKVLPPTIKVEHPNPELELESSPFHLATRARPWVRDSRHPRRAAVSAFGFGGSNFHVALSEYQGDAPTIAPRLRSLEAELVTICGPNPEAVIETARTHVGNATKSGYLPWLARASQSAFQAVAGFRLALVATDGDDLVGKLNQAIERIGASPRESFSTPTGIHYGTAARSGDLAFLFPGQGSQYIDMGGSLAMAFERAIEPWDAAADAAVVNKWDGKLHEVVFPQDTFTAADRAQQSARLAATEWAQPAIGTVSLSMLSLLDDLGLEADCFGGHSFGEVTALAAAGVISRSDLLDVARTRGTLMRDEATVGGAMTAVTASMEQVRELLGTWSTDVVIANHNHPQQVVLSGPTDAVGDVETKLKAEGITTKRLPVATAFHSPIVAGAAAAFGSYLASVDFSKAAKPVYSNTTGDQHGNDPRQVAAALAGQLAKPVLFVDMIESMYASGVRAFVEVGPGAVQTGLVGRILADRAHLAVNLDRKGKPGLVGFLEGLATLAAAGYQFEFDALWAGYRESDNPLERTEPKLSIPLTGANYGKPYPPAGGAADLPRPNPPRVTEPVGKGHVADPVGASASIAAPVPAVVPVTHQPVSAAPPVDGWSDAIEATQRQTADAHATYLQMMAETHTAFLETMERGLRFGLSGGAAPEAPPVAAVPPVAAPAAVLAPQETPKPPPAAIPVIPPSAGDDMTVPATVVAADSGMSADDLFDLMVGVVSDKTGYPVEMLELGMDLEGDLGIDSIKRVEILSEVSVRRPGLPELDTAVLGDLRTLGEVVDYLGSTLGGASPVVASHGGVGNGAVANGANPVTVAVRRFVLKRREQPAIGVALHGLYGDGPILVSAHAGQFELIARLRSAGIDAAEFDLAGPVAGARGLILFGSESHHADFELAKSVVPTLGDGVFVTIQNTGGTFGDADPDRAWTAGLAGLTRTIGQEYPNLTVKALDVADPNVAERMAAVADELVAGGPEINVGLPLDGRRLVLEDAPLEARPGAHVLAEGDVVVASGGARGVTATTLIQLAATMPLRFVLLGRTTLAEEPECCQGVESDAALKTLLLSQATEAGEKLTPAALGRRVSEILAGREIRSTIAAITDQGSQARYVTVDVTSSEGVSQALDEVRAEWGPIAAIVHGAGVIADKVIVDKTREQFDLVFDTKVDGLRSLLAATSDDSLKAICLFSSVAARTGNVGQSDYAMANEVLNKVAVAEAARRPGCVVKSFAWGPWEGGMVGPALKARFEALGVPLIPLEVGARMFVEELTDAALDEVELVIGSQPVDGPLPADGARVVMMDVLVGPGSNPQLADHAIDGTPVVPVVAAMEWFVRAANAVRPGQVVSRLLDLDVVRGIPVDGEVRLVLKVEDVDATHLAVSLSGSDGSLRYRCVVEMASRYPQGPSVTSLHDLSPWDERSVYDSRALFHGPRFQVIASIDGIGAGGLGVTLRPVGEMGWPQQEWHTDPAILDGGLQAALLWNEETVGGASLPTRIGEVRFYATGAAQGEVSCQVKAQTVEGPLCRFDVQFVVDGVVVTEFVGLETHIRPTPAASTASS